MLAKFPLLIWAVMQSAVTFANTGQYFYSQAILRVNDRDAQFYVESLCPASAVAMTSKVCNLEPRYLPMNTLAGFLHGQILQEEQRVQSEIVKQIGIAKKSGANPVGAALNQLLAVAEKADEESKSANAERDKVAQRLAGAVKEQSSKRTELESAHAAFEAATEARLKDLHKKAIDKLMARLDELEVQIFHDQRGFTVAMKVSNEAAAKKAETRRHYDSAFAKADPQTSEISDLRRTLLDLSEQKNLSKELLISLASGLPYPSDIYSEAEEKIWKQIQEKFRTAFWLTDGSQVEVFARNSYPKAEPGIVGAESSVATLAVTSFKVNGGRLPTISVDYSVRIDRLMLDWSRDYHAGTVRGDLNPKSYTLRLLSTGEPRRYSQVVGPFNAVSFSGEPAQVELGYLTPLETYYGPDNSPNHPLRLDPYWTVYLKRK